MKRLSWEEKVVGGLKEMNWTIATAESCTGGLVGASLVNVSGASEVYSEGYITYTNEAKQKLLGVSAETLRRYTAVSAPTAREMACGALKRSGADVAVSVTGIAGPGGGSEEQPVGLVYIACAVKKGPEGEAEADCLRYVFDGDRGQIRRKAARCALKMVNLRLERERTAF